MKLKKLLASILASAMVLSTMSLAAFAQSSDAADYDALAAALEAAAAGDVINVTAAVALTDNITVPQGVTLNTNGLLDAAGCLITLSDGASVTTEPDDSRLNTAVTASGYLPEYTVDAEKRTYRVSNVVFKSPEVFMAGHKTVITSQNGTDSDTNLFLTYTAEDSNEYTVLYNSTTAARIFGGWKYPTADQSGVVTSLTIESGKADSLRGGSKDKACTAMNKADIVVNGGDVGIVASGWYYNQSVKEFNVEVNSGKVGTIYGNGETSYKSSTEMEKLHEFIPTVDTANITVNGGTVGYVYGSGRAVTQAATSADYAMLTKTANINIKGGNITCVNGGGFNSPEANWGETTGQDLVTVEQAVINVSGGKIANLFAGGYNGQWKYTYKLNADGELVYSNYNGTDETTRSVRNIVENSTVNIYDGADITNLYAGSRSYAMTKNAKVNMYGGSVAVFSASGNYGYTQNSNVSVIGGEISKLELVTRNYVGDINLNVTGGNVQEFYAGTGGAYKNANCVEKEYNISTTAILGDVNISFADGTVTAAYLTTGLERAAAVTSNVPLTVKTMSLAEDSGYTGEFTQTGNFEIINEASLWNTTVLLSDEDQSLKPNGSADLIVLAAEDSMIAVKNDEGVYVIVPNDGSLACTKTEIVTNGLDGEAMKYGVRFVFTYTGTAAASGFGAYLLPLDVFEEQGNAGAPKIEYTDGTLSSGQSFSADLIDIPQPTTVYAIPFITGGSLGDGQTVTIPEGGIQ